MLPITRRQYLASSGGALLAASGLPALANHQPRHDKDDAEVLYGHGMVWNRELPGVAGEVKLSFDLRVNLETGAGFGTASDPVHPDWNIHFTVDSAQKEQLPGGERRLTLAGVVTHATNPASVGLPVKILAETRGDATAIAVVLGDLAFVGAGLVVIAVIGVLISLLLPGLPVP